ncbi:hypothetical protein vseg_000452 [Gypsophila vaccaria]
MGCGNSRQLGLPPKVNRCKHRLSSLFCSSCSSQRTECRVNSRDSLLLSQQFTHETPPIVSNASESSSSRNIQQFPRDHDSLFQSSAHRNETNNTTAEPKLDQQRPSMGQSPQPLVGLGLNSNTNTVNNAFNDDDDISSIFDEVNLTDTESCPVPVPAVSVSVSGPGIGIGIANQSRGNEAVRDSIDSEATINSRTGSRNAFPSRTSTSLAEYPALLLSTTQDADFMGSRRSRWLLDIGHDVFESNSLHVARRSRLPTHHPQTSTSEFWDRLRGAAIESRDRVACPLDLHSHGSCTCELDEAASALSSISRIVLLAEALFEVLDEIHHQPDSFSLSVPSIPSPESVVDLLPLRTYEKPSTTGCGEDVDQCYICLVEYDEGDKIRILPCRHEYHMSCVDKWLKEIHGICPLCRGEVRGEVLEENAASSADAAVTYAA